LWIRQKYRKQRNSVPFSACQVPDLTGVSDLRR